MELHTVSTRPVDSFSARLVTAAAERAFDVVFTSQTTYLLQVWPSTGCFVLRSTAPVLGLSDAAFCCIHWTTCSWLRSIWNVHCGNTLQPRPPPLRKACCRQETLVPDVARLVTGLRHALSAHWTASSEDMPLVIVDGYHGFGAIPTDLSAVAAECCYVGCASLPQGISGGRFSSISASACCAGSRTITETLLLFSIMSVAGRARHDPCLEMHVQHAWPASSAQLDTCCTTVHQGVAEARGVRCQRGVHERAGGAAPAPGRYRLARGRERPGSRLRRPAVARRGVFVCRFCKFPTKDRLNTSRERKCAHNRRKWLMPTCGIGSSQRCTMQLAIPKTVCSRKDPSDYWCTRY